MAPCTTLYVLVVVLSASRTFAQSIPDLEVGSRVRLVAAAVSPQPLIGTIVRLDATTLELQTADRKQPTLVPRDALTKIEISLGRRSRTRGVLVGALVGAAIGVIAVLATPEEPCQPSDILGCPAFGISQGEGAVYIGGVGAVSGALIGSLIPPGERWKAATAGPRVSVGPAHKGGVQISLSFGF